MRLRETGDKTGEDQQDREVRAPNQLLGTCTEVANDVEGAPRPTKFLADAKLDKVMLKELAESLL